MMDVKKVKKEAVVYMYKKSGVISPGNLVEIPKDAICICISKKNNLGTAGPTCIEWLEPQD